MKNETVKEMPFWCTADHKSVDDLIKLMEEFTIDPVFLNYGGYAGVTPIEHFHPDHRAESRPYIMVNFFDLSWTYQGEPTRHDILKVKKTLRSHFKTERFLEAFHQRFNCISIELTAFWDKDTYKNHFKMNGDWYHTIKSDMLFPIDGWWSQEFKDEWKRMDEMGRNLKHVSSYYLKIQFYERHYTNSEYKELMEFEFPKHKTGNGTIIGQAHRTDFSRETLRRCKEFTFKSTGRRILYDPESSYSFMYKEIDPFITKPIKL